MSPDPTADIYPVPPDHFAFEFLVPGAPDRARPFALEVIAQLPETGRLWLEAPASLIYDLRAHSPFVRITGDRGLLALPAHGRRRFEPGLLAAGSRNRVRLLVHVPVGKRRYGGEIAVRQLYQEVEVGRVTVRLASGTP